MRPILVSCLSFDKNVNPLGLFQNQDEMTNKGFCFIPPFVFLLGTMVPQPCPNGTYTLSDLGGLQEERECSPCPPGKFCRYTVPCTSCTLKYSETVH